MSGLAFAAVVAVLVAVVIAGMVIDHRNRKQVTSGPNYSEIERLEHELFPDDEDNDREV